MLAESLRIGVDIGPAPPRRPLDAEIREPRARPDFPFARDGEAQGIGIVGVATFFVQAFPRQFAKARQHHRVAGLIADALGELGAVFDFLLDRKLIALQFMLARKIAEHRIALPNRA